MLFIKFSFLDYIRDKLLTIKSTHMKNSLRYLHFNYPGILIITFLLFVIPAGAVVRIPGILSSNMVIQRDHAITVWGWADKGEKVSVSFNSVVKNIRADKEGKWKIILPQMQAGGPYQMEIKGKNTIKLDNIMIGDVWICSGQSNMQWELQRANDGEKEVANSGNPAIRLINIKRTFQKEPADDVESTSWQECSPQSVATFSAVGYFFGRHLSRELNVPIGLIGSNWGGTNVEAWTSMDFLTKIEKYTNYPAELAANLLKTDSLSRVRYNQPNNYHSSLYNGMIHPLLNFAIKGAIWYQGESNASQAYLYRSLFPNMIECWRNKWKQPELPFLFVQLANYRDELPKPAESDWAELREAQLMTLALPNTGMAVIIDIGEAKDIHPRNKQDVGYRLALSALKIAYDRQVVHSGPIYRSMEVDGDKAILSFNHVGSGLVAKDKYGYLKAFSVTGEDRQFHWAKAEIKGDKVIVRSDKVIRPVAVRYAWANNPADANFYNMEGLPATPFRTDDWEGITLKNSR